MPRWCDDHRGMSATTETTGQPGPFGFAKMAGSSIAGRDAAAWVTDFLNAAYYRRPVDERDVDDLRFAFGVLTTYWYRTHPSRRLRVTDLPAFHRAFGAERFGARSRARLLSREALERGAAKLIGDWFPEAYADDARRGVGHRVPDGRRARRLRPVAPAGAGQARRADGRERAAGGAGLAHLRAGRDAVRRGRDRRADAARDVAGLRERDRPLHAAARRAGSRARRSRSRSRPTRARRCRSSRAAT